MNPHIVMTGLGLVVLASTIPANANPRLNSWYTAKSGQYARIYPMPADEANGMSVTTWNRGAGVQAMPTYAGVHEITHTNNWVYIRTTGLASHVMGPWQNGNFGNFPANQAAGYRFPLVPPPLPATRTLTGLGAIGYFVDGVAMFDSRDAFSHDHSTGQDETPRTAQDPNIEGDDIWNRDAYVNEAPTFDAANAHQANSQYHYHANPPALRHLLGDSVTYDDTTNTYTESFNGNHSPILGWARDGYPVYGPYGYDDPNDPTSPVTRMLSGFQPRDGTNGSTDITTLGRTTYPAWATRTYTHTFQAGPAVNAAHPLGHYMEDNTYKGDLGLSQGTVVTGTDDFHLDEFNGRMCVTPEFPDGTYAYFTCISPTGDPVFPYNIGRRFYGDPVGGPAGQIPANDDPDPATTIFEGGPERTASMQSLSVDEENGDVIVVWDGVERATYEVLGSSDMQSWSVLDPTVTAGGITPGFAHSGQINNQSRYFYKVNKTAIAPFDDAGFVYDSFYVDGPQNQNITTGEGIQTLVIHLNPADAANIPGTLGTNPSSVLVGGQAASFVERLSRFVLVAKIDPDTAGLTDGDYNITVDFGTGPTTAQNLAIVGSAPKNILFMIVDDWGVDSSPIDNPTGNVAVMPHLEDLAANGLRFTRAFVTPVCSPTRSCIMTGRHAHQTGVYVPGNAGAFSNPNNEFTLPEAVTASGAPYAMASTGKWHLGGNNNGYSARGGWPEFYGITGGGVNPAYDNWTKNTNGASAVTTTYSTLDQVKEARDFIQRSETSGDPWLCWVAFNAPHTPFHDPATVSVAPGDPSLIPPGGYSVGTANDTELYIRMLETLDHLIGWLFDEVNAIDSDILSNTNIILIGDNGTPNGVVQAPFGNGNSKGDLYNGGTNVPLVVQGPAVAPNLVGTTTNKLVHAVDFYTTLMELAGIDPTSVPGIPTTALAQSTSIVPILKNTDTADRCIITEGGEGAARGRAIILDDYPDYKMIIFGDPETTLDSPRVEFYNITSDFNEQSPLYDGPVVADPSPTLSGSARDAFIACYDKDQAMGGGFSDPASGGDTLYIEVNDPPGQPNVPQLQNGLGNDINPSSIVVDGSPATFIARVNSGTDLSDEADDAADRFWIKCIVPSAPPYNDATITFTVQGNDRVFNENDPILVKP
ncbi:MAG: YHYH protein [Verrucomicrobiota bacterium]